MNEGAEGLTNLVKISLLTCGTGTKIHLHYLWENMEDGWFTFKFFFNLKAVLLL